MRGILLRIVSNPNFMTYNLCFVDTNIVLTTGHSLNRKLQYVLLICLFPWWFCDLNKPLIDGFIA